VTSEEKPRMSTRYIVDETGERVSVIIDVADYERMVEAQTKVVEAARVLQEAVRMMSGSGSSGTGYAGYRRALKTLDDAQRALFGAMSRLETLEYAEAIRTYEADTEKLERGEDDLLS
jgi:hypothetical protein